MRSTQGHRRIEGRTPHLHSLPEAGAEQREEDSGHGHVVPGLGHTRVLTASVDAHAPGDVPHRHLVALETTGRGGGVTQQKSHSSNACTHGTGESGWVLKHGILYHNIIGFNFQNNGFKSVKPMEKKLRKRGGGLYK